MDLRQTLNTAKNIKNDTPAQDRRVSRQSVQTYTGTVESIEREFFKPVGQILDENGRPEYDAKEDMKRVTSGLPNDMSNCKLPTAIMESIVNNPLIMSHVDPKMDAFTNELSKKIPGVSKVANIMSKLDEEDREKEAARKAAINESLQHTVTANVDYNLIKSIVETAVNSLRDELRNELNESINRTRSRDTSLAAMKMTDKFLFLDNDNNVFECQMVYKGKNKKKN